jgi:hypothetical protein
MPTAMPAITAGMLAIKISAAGIAQFEGLAAIQARKNTTIQKTIPMSTASQRASPCFGSTDAGREQVKGPSFQIARAIMALALGGGHGVR